MILPYTPTRVRTRSYHLLKAMVESGLHVTLATVWENDEERHQLSLWEGRGVRVIGVRLGRVRKLVNLSLALPTRVPLQSRFCWHPTLANMIRLDLHRNAYDAIHVEHLRGAEYGLYTQACLRSRGVYVPVVWDSVDCISLLYEQASVLSQGFFGRWVTRFELPRTRRYEARMLRQFEHILVSSPVDRHALLNLAGLSLDSHQVHVLKNGVDLDYYSKSTEERPKDRIIFSGKMSYHANEHAALYLIEQIMPHVWKVLPQTRVQLVGQDPPNNLVRLAEKNRRVEVIGKVPHIVDYLQQACLAVAPVIYGVGIQNKVLEAMACSIPVVASPQAVAALEIIDGRDCLVAQTPEEFAQKIIELLENEAKATKIGANGRAYVEAHHDWNVMVADLLSIYDRY